jgi:hypothetical protein
MQHFLQTFLEHHKVPSLLKLFELNSPEPRESCVIHLIDLVIRVCVILIDKTK